jgi:hypothetical protein
MGLSHGVLGGACSHSATPKGSIDLQYPSLTPAPEKPSVSSVSSGKFSAPSLSCPMPFYKLGSSPCIVRIIEIMDEKAFEQCQIYIYKFHYYSKEVWGRGRAVVSTC